MLRLGDHGAKVLQLQQRLSALGYWLGDPDGAFGDSTLHAVVALQKVAGLDRDGVVGPVTERALAAGAQPAPLTHAGVALEVHLGDQVVLVVSGGRLVATLDASTGSGTTYVVDGRSHLAVTPEGHYSVTRRVDGWDRSPLGLLWRPAYFNNGIAIHGFTSVPAYPASHGCVRVTIAAMNWLWANGRADIGTPVLVS